MSERAAGDPVEDSPSAADTASTDMASTDMAPTGTAPTDTAPTEPTPADTPSDGDPLADALASGVAESAGLAESERSVEERALAWAGLLSASAPWDEVAGRLTVLLTAPPLLPGITPHRASCWLVLDPTEARILPDPWRSALGTGGVHVARVQSADGLPASLAVLTEDAAARVLDGVTRRALEARWSVRHGRAVHDPLHRHEAMMLAAGRLPADRMESIVRPLFLQVVAGVRALAAAEPDPAGIGEAGAAVARLACVLEEGFHPPTEWLLPVARETRLGQRVGSWFTDLGPAMAGDERARRWVADAGDGVLRQLTEVLRAEFSGRAWLQDPESYSLRPPR